MIFEGFRPITEALKAGMGVGNRGDIYMRIHKGESFIDIRYNQLKEAIENIRKQGD